MVKNKLLKISATFLSAAVLANTCVAGTFSANEPEAAVSGAISEPAYVDNSSLIPVYKADSAVTLELSDDGTNYWTPDWVKTLITVEVNVSTASSDGKFSGMTGTLDHLAKAGVNGIWLTPINDTYGDRNRYSNHGPDTVSSLLTGTTNYTEGWQEVKNFVDQAHSRNIRVFFDIVTWGADVESPLVTSNPNYFISTTETNKYGGYSFDWTNSATTGLYNYFKQSVTDAITVTGADGFRADCGSLYAGTQLFRDIRTSLLALENPRKIAIFSENPETRDGTFDFEEHSSETNWAEAYKYYIDNNIVDAIHNATFFGNGTNVGKYYSALVSCHDNASYTANNNLISFGYASLFSPLLPIWYLGEEWNNTESENITSLYRTGINWGEIETNRAYFEKVKQYIRVRRQYSEVFENFANDANNSYISKVTTNDTSLLQAYARYGGGNAVIIVPNNSTEDKALSVTVPQSIGLSATETYRIKNCLTNEVIINGVSAAQLSDFEATVGAGTMGVYAIEKCMNVASVSLNSVTNICTSHDVGVSRAVDIYFNKDINTGNNFNASYYGRHLTVDAAHSIGNATSVGQVARQNILINGYSLEELISADVDAQYNSIHISVVAGSQGTYLRVAIPVNNCFGIESGESYTVTLLDGLEINGYAVRHTNIHVTDRAAFSGSTAKICDKSYADGNITLTFDRYIENSADDIATLIGSKIEIAGSAISASAVTVSGKKIIIPYSSSAPFAFYLKSGIILNGYELDPTRYTITPEQTAVTGAVTYGQTEIADTQGAVTPYYAYINESTLSQYGCSDPAHDQGNMWVVNVVISGASAANTIKPTIASGTNYWMHHLQVYSGTSGAVQNKILLNGKSIAQCITESGLNAYSAVHVFASDNTIQIAIPKNNIYGFDATKAFTVTFDEGFTLNGLTFNPRNFNCPGWDGSMEYNANYFSKVLKNVEYGDGYVAETGTINVNSVSSGFCTSHGTDYAAVEQWVVDIYFDSAKAIKDSSIASYYTRHLQASGWTSVNTSPYTDIRNKILVNGKDLDELLALSTNYTDVSQYIHIQANSDSNYLRIAIPKDNTYGFNGNGTFSIEILDGLVMNGHTLTPYKVTKSITSEATFVEPVISSNRQKPAVLEGTNTAVYVYFDGYDLAAGLGNNMAHNGSASNANAVLNSQKEIATAICENLKINGEKVGDGAIRGNLLSVWTTISNGCITLKFAADNAYHVSTTEPYTIELTDGLKINGYKIQPFIIAYNGSAASISNSGKYWVQNMALGGQSSGYYVVPRTVGGSWINNVAGGSYVSAGDTIQFNVYETESNRLKAGTLTYTYWYKGVKRVIPVTRFYDRETGITGKEYTRNTRYEFTAPGVVGVLNAEFTNAVGTEEMPVNMATLGAQHKKTGTQGMRFVNRLYLDNVDWANKTVTVDGTNYDISECAIQLAIGNGTSWANAIKLTDFEVVSDSTGVYVDFGASIVNIPESLYNTQISARAFIKYYSESYQEDVYVYTNTVTKTMKNIIG